jgi:hypothetical protein
LREGYSFSAIYAARKRGRRGRRRRGRGRG